MHIVYLDYFLWHDDILFYEDDIDLEDMAEKPKEQNVLAAALKKQNIASKFNAFKGQQI